MDKAEFDRFADAYNQIHAASLGASGESPDFFAEYKVRVTAQLIDVAVQTQPRLLDFGVGIGNSIPHFRHYIPHVQLTCLDISEKSLEIAAQRFPGEAIYTCFDGTHLPFPDACFEVIFSACVFHHIEHGEHSSLLRDMHRVLRPGGMAIVFEHNPLNPLTLQVVNNCPFDENARLLRAGQLCTSFMAAGFARPRARYHLFFPNRLRVLRPLERHLEWLPLGAQYSVAAHKR
jgi:ubiquinone/menaquinone biosynthesis C-methylase UbiE